MHPSYRSGFTVVLISHTGCARWYRGDQQRSMKDRHRGGWEFPFLCDWLCELIGGFGSLQNNPRTETMSFAEWPITSGGLFARHFISKSWRPAGLAYAPSATYLNTEIHPQLPTGVHPVRPLRSRLTAIKRETHSRTPRKHAIFPLSKNRHDCRMIEINISKWSRSV